MTILIIGSHPNNSNGYSKVIYNLCKHMSEKVYIYGCQRSNVEYERILPENITVWDVSKNELWNDKHEFGFNFHDIGKYLSIIRPTVVLIYNDCYVCYKFIESIISYDNICKYDFQFKIVIYVDLVYPFIKEMYINCFNEYVNSMIVYHDHWKEFLISSKIKCNISVLSHGCATKYCEYTSKTSDCFTILNLNRNTHRKRLDITIRGFIYAIQRSKINLKLYIKEPHESDVWDILELFKQEMTQTNITEHVVFIKNDISDIDINNLYDRCDIGLNTCEGEGFGLCNYEHACHGKPQIMPDFVQLKTLYPNESIIELSPKYDYFIEKRDAVGGLAKVVDYIDVGKAILTLTVNEVYDSYCKNMKKINPKSYKDLSKLLVEYIS